MQLGKTLVSSIIYSKCEKKVQRWKIFKEEQSTDVKKSWVSCKCIIALKIDMAEEKTR